MALLLSSSLLAAEHTVSFTPATNAPAIAREKAIGLVEQYLGLGMPGGLPTGVTVTAEYGLATDTWIPFFKVANRPAWRVTFDGLALSCSHTGNVPNASIWITIQSGLGGHPDHELLHHVDATTGRGFEMRGLGNGGSHFGY